MFNPEDLAYDATKERKRFKLPRPPKPGKRTATILSSVLAISILSAGGYYLYQRSLPPKDTPEVLAEKKIQAKVEEARENAREILDIMSKQTKLPRNEEPMFATVTEDHLLKSQDFFRDAQNGDKIVMYTKNKKAFLYRPREKRILTEAPLIYGNQPIPVGSESAEPAAAGPGRIIVEPGNN